MNAPRSVDRGTAGELVPLRSPEAPPHNLPEQLTSFVGRERELRELAEALSETRILTLTGAGGCGKSRLALRAAADGRERFPDGAWWVELAAVSDPELVAPALGQVFGLRPLPGQSELEALLSYLAPRRALILLDNCEHLLEECARLAGAVARRCPELTVLATSREPLRVPGETDWRVPSLSLPPDSGNGGADGAGRSDAVRLFVERAAKVRPGFRLNDENAPALVRICRGLDGIPLAIELAAARLGLLSVEQIEERLADRFRLLTGGTRTALPRHRTLRASVEWSHELLSDAERTLFRRLGVFMGGFTVEAAERVCAADGIESEEVLDLLASLVEKSLVQTEDRGSAVRCRLLETVRQHALERLAEAGETERLRDRHRDFYLELAERFEPDYFTPRQPEILRLLDPESANLTQATGWAVETEPEEALRLCVALRNWWRWRGYFAQGETAHRRALEAAGAERSVLRTRALAGRAHLLAFGGAYAAAIPAWKEALEEAEEGR